MKKVKKLKKTKEVKCSEDFGKFFESLSEDDPFKTEINKMKDILQVDYTSGDKIRQDRWPNYYIKKYKITNLWKHNLPDAKRLAYTILGREEGLNVSIIEAFTSHAKYEKRFGY